MSPIRTITKKFGPYPAAHRQYTHQGHCALIHGHNWYVEVQLGTVDDSHLDENGFVFDFGDFKDFKLYLTDLLDHTLLISSEDPELSSFEVMKEGGLCDLRVLEGGTSAEHMAERFARELDLFLQRRYPPEAGMRRPLVFRVTVHEDEKNQASVEYTVSHISRVA